MKKKVTSLLYCFIILISISGFAQRFKKEISVKETFFTPDGKSMYIFSEKDGIYLWDIQEGKIEKEWTIPNKTSKMFFVAGTTYLYTEVITKTYDAIRKLYKYNTSTDNFDLYYKIKDAYYNKSGNYVYETLESIGKDGSVVTFLHSGSSKKTSSTWGPLFLNNPTTNSKKEIIKWTVSGSTLSEPFFQPTFHDQLICMDFTKYHFDKKKVNLYNLKKDKHIAIRKKVKYSNSALHGFNNVFVFEYINLNKNSSEYTIYNALGDEIQNFAFGKYHGLLFDYTNKEIYFRHESGKQIDVYSVNTNKIIKKLAAFPDFFIQSKSSAEPIRAIQNGKHYRYVNESAYMRELIGYVEEFNFKTGEYLRVGKPLRDGYNFEKRDELHASAMVKKANDIKDAKQKNTENFKVKLAMLPLATNTGNTMNLREQGSKIHNNMYNLVSVGCYGQLAEHAIKLAESGNRVLMLIQSDETSSNLKGDYKIDITKKNYYASVVNSNSKYEKIIKIGEDVHETHTNKHTIKVEKSGWHSTPTNFTWRITNDDISISSPKGTFRFDKKTCLPK